IATSFNAPFITIPGSGFAQTFIGVDALIVRALAYRAKRLAKKWGGQCIVFIDEIDAVGMRRAALGAGMMTIGEEPERLRAFIGATNVPLQSLDPALTRPGRMGRHVWFRTPTKDDRKDIFDLYLSKVAHAADLDEAKRRDEIARITNGYSPAMVEQVCSLALT